MKTESLFINSVLTSHNKLLQVSASIQLLLSSYIYVQHSFSTFTKFNSVWYLHTELCFSQFICGLKLVDVPEKCILFALMQLQLYLSKHIYIASSSHKIKGSRYIHKITCIISYCFNHYTVSSFQMY